MATTMPHVSSPATDVELDMMDEEDREALDMRHAAEQEEELLGKKMALHNKVPLLPSCCNTILACTADTPISSRFRLRAIESHLISSFSRWC